MNGRRWIALAIAAVLLVVSIGFQLVTSVATTNFEDVFSGSEELFDETVIEEGSPTQRIAVLSLEGVIQDTGTNSWMNTSGYDHQRFLKMIEEAGEDNSIKGIVLNVNSPGGGVVESAEIHDKIVEVKEETDKPIYVSMGNTAASGGYYVSAPADKIVANPATITGSIGVIMESINYAELADQYGVDFNTIKSGEFKDIMSGSREMTAEEQEILQTIVDDMYADFVQVIVDGRGMDESRVRELGDGRIYTGAQAQENGLVDELGTLDDTIAMMEEDQDIENASVIQYRSNFQFNQFLGVTAKNFLGMEQHELFGLANLIRESDSPRAMYLYTR
ncbi:signal peptide peptidase SppA [Sediminibacillus massiliensis]|uniref:signal peptide peptidase SppA n=1 Tax=Sediminibacillus massiliensis TaxID=1926277 RepID=UPI0009884099|nr:signal peptide peptidase SppA [Sediminibacillus massiliensis]